MKVYLVNLLQGSDLVKKVTLINGDCLEALKNIQDNTVDLILTDPPYNLGNFMRERKTNLKKNA